MENNALKKNLKIHFLLIVLILSGMGFCEQAFAQASSNKFKQWIEWSADENALEYKLEIMHEGKIVNTFTTSENFVNLNLPAGEYEYCITVYDFLGRAQDVSEWQKFEISKASEPVFKNIEENVEIDVSSGNKIVLPVEVDNVAEGASVALVNVKTGEEIKGTLLLSDEVEEKEETEETENVISSGKSETGKASAEFPKFSSGEWKLVVENPSGLTSESPAISIKTVDKEKEAAVKAEQEELERLAKEEAERKAAEEERLAKEKAEQEKLAAERAEKERLAVEEAERKREEVLARQEEKAQKKAERAARKTLSIEIKVGAASPLNLFNSDLLSLKNYDTLTQGVLPEIVTLAPLAAISYVPNFDWLVRPGIEVSAFGFVYESHSAAFGNDKWEYKQQFCYNNVKASFIGQITLLPQKIFFDVKAGGGITEILVATEYVRDRESVTKAFTYPTLNVGVSFEFVPLKNLVFEIGADYNRILSNKLNFSYLMPYLEVGVRF